MITEKEAAEAVDKIAEAWGEESERQWAETERRWKQMQKRMGEAIKQPEMRDPVADAVVYGTGHGKAFWGAPVIKDDLYATAYIPQQLIDDLTKRKPGELIRLLVFNGGLS